MILRLYQKLFKIAEQHLTVNSCKIIYLPSGEPQKLRIFIIDGTILDVWLAQSGKYSYHWDRRNIQKGIYRFDNAPHKKWKKIKSYPHHLHFKSEEKVIESNISKKFDEALMEVLNFIQDILAKESEAK